MFVLCWVVSNLAEGRITLFTGTSSVVPITARVWFWRSDGYVDMSVLKLNGISMASFAPGINTQLVIMYRFTAYIADGNNMERICWVVVTQIWGKRA